MHRYQAAGPALSAFDYLMDACHEPCVDSIPLPGQSGRACPLNHCGKISMPRSAGPFVCPGSLALPALGEGVGPSRSVRVLTLAESALLPFGRKQSLLFLQIGEPLTTCNNLPVTLVKTIETYRMWSSQYVRQVDYLERNFPMSALVKTSKTVLAVAMLSALFACGQQGGEGGTSGESGSSGMSGSSGASSGSTGSAASSDSGTGNPAVDGILSGSGSSGSSDSTGSSSGGAASGTSGGGTGGTAGSSQ